MKSHLKIVKSNFLRQLKFICFVLFLLIWGGLVYAYIEARNIRLVQLTVEDKDIPEAFVGTKIVFISDIHCDQYFLSKDVRRLVDRVNDLKPDIILIGGDFVSESIYIDTLFSEIGKLRSTYGVYMVSGNHDHWTDLNRIKKGLTEYGFNDCDNKSYWINNGSDNIKIGGVGDLWCDSQRIENTINDVKTDDFCILLSHHPDFIDDLKDIDNIDLMLSGHTHGGQMTLFGLWTPLMPGATRSDLKTTKHEYRYGWIEKDNVKLYITSGIGMGNFPFRFFAHPEIVEITLLNTIH